MAESYLLDTSIVSEFAPNRQPMPGKVAAWMAAHETRFHLAAITFAELNEGIARLRRAGAVQRADSLQNWLADTGSRFGDRILSLDATGALAAGEIADLATAGGVHPGLADVLIAATAQVRNLTVVTRNLKHFIPLGVACLDPFEPR